MPCRNVEIKAKVKNFGRLQELARSITNSEPEILQQKDIFYEVSTGRLKLRTIQNKNIAQLVYYNRADVEGPKLSDYTITEVTQPDQLGAILKAALGEVGTVEKTRYLYLFEQTRIHIDDVKNLGNFMELEVVLTADQTVEEGQTIAEELMQKLEINTEDLLSGAYLDLLVR